MPGENNATIENAIDTPEGDIVGKTEENVDELESEGAALPTPESGEKASPVDEKSYIDIKTAEGVVKAGETAKEAGKKEKEIPTEILRPREENVPDEEKDEVAKRFDEKIKSLEMQKEEYAKSNTELKELRSANEKLEAKAHNFSQELSEINKQIAANDIKIGRRERSIETLKSALGIKEESKKEKTKSSEENLKSL